MIVVWITGVLIILFVTVWFLEPRAFIVLFQKLVFRQMKTPFISDERFFPEKKFLEKNWHLIYEELMQVIHSKNVIPKFHEVDKANFKISFADGPAWRTIVLKAFDGWFPSNCEKFPVTVDLLQRCSSVSTAMFSILEPKVKIPPHTGKFNGILRYHLALVVPSASGCFINVGGEKRAWKCGEGLLFDDTYLHEVINDTDEYRIVLFLDVKRKSNVLVNAVNNCFFQLVTVSPLFKRSVRKGRIGLA